MQHDVTAFVSDTDSQAAAELIRAALADPNISVEAVGERVLLRGEVAGEGDKLNAETTAKAIYPKVDNLLIGPQNIEAHPGGNQPDRIQDGCDEKQPVLSPARASTRIEVPSSLRPSRRQP